MRSLPSVGMEALGPPPTTSNFGRHWRSTQTTARIWCRIWITDADGENLKLLAQRASLRWFWNQLSWFWSGFENNLPDFELDLIQAYLVLGCFWKQLSWAWAGSENSLPSFGTSLLDFDLVLETAQNQISGFQNQLKRKLLSKPALNQLT